MINISRAVIATKRRSFITALILMMPTCRACAQKVFLFNTTYFNDSKATFYYDDDFIQRYKQAGALFDKDEPFFFTDEEDRTVFSVKPNDSIVVVREQGIYVLDRVTDVYAKRDVGSAVHVYFKLDTACTDIWTDGVYIGKKQGVPITCWFDYPKPIPIDGKLIVSDKTKIAKHIVHNKRSIDFSLVGDVKRDKYSSLNLIFKVDSITYTNVHNSLLTMIPNVAFSAYGFGNIYGYTSFIAVVVNGYSFCKLGASFCSAFTIENNKYIVLRESHSDGGMWGKNLYRVDKDSIRLINSDWSYSL